MAQFVNKLRDCMRTVNLTMQLVLNLFFIVTLNLTVVTVLDEIWGMDSESDDKTVNVHINRLRTRFYDWPEFEIQTIRGIGYRAIKKV